MAKRLLTLLAGCILVGACQGTPEVQTGEDAEVIGNNLHRVDNSRAAKSYVNPDVDFSQYNQVLLPPLVLNDVTIIQPTRSNGRPGNTRWELTEDDKAMLQEAFRKAMTQKISENDGYAVVTSPGRGVIAVIAKLLTLAPSAAKDDMSSRATGRSRVFTEGAGTATIEIAFVDAQSGEVLAVAVDGKSGQSTWGINNSVTNRADIQRMFNAWAAQIRSSLDNLRARQ
jgi:hypothetical protein